MQIAMWVRGAAIRPVPPYAVVQRDVLDRVEAELAEGGLGAKSELDDAFERFEQTQPALAQRAADILAAVYGACASVVLAFGGWQMAMIERESGTQIGAGIPAWITQLVLPVSFALIALSLAVGEPGFFAPTPLVLAAFAFQAVVVAFASFTAWFWLMRRYPASRLAAFTFLAPVFGVAFGGWLLGERVSALLVVSLALISFGVWLVNRPPVSSARA